MSDLIRSLIRSGVAADDTSLPAKFVLLLNRAVLIVFLISFISNLALTPLGFIAPLFYLSLIYQAMILATWLFNRFGWRTFARVYFIGLSALFLSSNALLIGKALGFHLYLLAVILLTYFLFPPAEKGLALVLAAASLFAFLALEFYFAEHDSILPPAHFAELGDKGKLPTHVSLALLLSGLAYYIYSTYLRAEEALDAERRQSEALLLNILPAPIARRLKSGESFIADRFERAAVLFADLVNFTALAESRSPEQIVRLLNEIFSDFDRETELLGLEKIKTIGDAYMVAGGVPDGDSRSLNRVADLALAMQSVMHKKYQGDYLLRIGIHCGPVVAGIIGQRKFIYDLWGDTVNLASRMESHGIAGGINVSAAAFFELEQAYRFEARGLVSVKGKADQEMYLLLGRK